MSVDELKGLKEFMSQHIKVPIYVQWGFIGSGYTQILIVEDGQIISIGEFLYAYYREGWYKRKSQFEALAKQAELYRTGQRLERLPCLNEFTPE